MDIDWKVIEGGNHRYLFELKEFKDGLPYGVINKKLPDVGGTYAAVNSECNYIIVCPTIDLVKSIAKDENNLYRVFQCFGKVSKTDFEIYECNCDKYKKIAVTYDKLELLTSWLNPEEYKLLVDEYHILLQSFDFREKAISSLFNTITLYKHISFLSATPINPEFEIKELRDLPHYEIHWDRTTTIVPHRLKTNGVIQTLCRIITMFQKGEMNAPDINCNISEVKELFIFINSVISIRQVCDTLSLNPDDVKICCSDKHNNRKLLDIYPIEDVSSPNKKINFFTSKCFQGCNLFSNDGLIIICSDCNKKSMVTDLSSDLIQIAGRLRFNEKYQNKFRNTLIHVYNTNSYVQSDEEFELFMDGLKDECNRLEKIQDKLKSDDDKQLIMKYLKIEYSVMTNEGDWYKYSENKEMYFRYFHKLRKSYRNGLAIRNAYPEGMEKTAQKYAENFYIKLSKCCLRGFQETINEFYNDKDKEKYYENFPEYRDYYKYLTLKEINTLRYNKDEMQKVCEDKKKYDNILSSIVTEGFMTLSEIKKKMSVLFQENNISIKPKANLIEKVTGYDFKLTKKKVDNNFENGYLITKKQESLF